jgi:hypothetical protein
MRGILFACSLNFAHQTRSHNNLYIKEGYQMKSTNLWAAAKSIIVIKGYSISAMVSSLLLSKSLQLLNSIICTLLKHNPALIYILLFVVIQNYRN